MVDYAKPTLGDIFNRRLGKTLNNFGVAAAGTVVSYDASTNTAAVRHGTYRLIPSMQFEGDDVVESIQDCVSVPVIWPHGDDFSIISELKAGDTVLLVCLDRDISGWRDDGSPAAPEDARLHDWANAVAIPGLVPVTSPYTPPDDAAALASKLDTLIGILKGWIPIYESALKAEIARVFPNIPALAALAAPIDLDSTTGSEVLKLGK
jgi:Phage protein Gp138 N-terminal domain